MRGLGLYVQVHPNNESALCSDRSCASDFHEKTLALQVCRFPNIRFSTTQNDPQCPCITWRSCVLSCGTAPLTCGVCGNSSLGVSKLNRIAGHPGDGPRIGCWCGTHAIELVSKILFSHQIVQSSNYRLVLLHFFPSCNSTFPGGLNDEPPLIANQTAYLGHDESLF